jgi:glycosyltransferase involved in cell wall biosynthesis
MNGDSKPYEISDASKLPAQPLVSVYMLAYNHEKFITTAIKNVIAQRHDFPIELVIGEDCSPDRTREIALEFQRTHPDLVRVITSNRNSGMRANSKRSMDACRGKYIAVCEGDDYWTHPSKLKRQVDLFADRPQLMLTSHYAQVLDEVTSTMRGVVRPAFSSRLLSMHELILGDGGLIPSASIMFRRDLLEHLPQWYYMAPVNDYPLVLVAGLLGEIAIQNCCMSVYRRNVEGSWTTRLKNTFEDRWEHACAMDVFFSMFDSDTGNIYQREVRQITSKFFSDALIRFDGNIQSKNKAFEQVKNRLSKSDRMFCLLALNTPFKFTTCKTALRKISSLSRMLRGEIQMPHLPE